MEGYETRLTALAHGGGCGCKLSPAVLRELLAGMPAARAFPDLLVGTETGDDAAVYRISDEQAVVATTDFFMPIVDDPRDFGRIAAANALSDIYAMGGKPLMALAVLGMPLGKIAPETVSAILAGGASICEEAGIPVAGGHSIDSPEPIYGLVAIGLVDPRRLQRNSDAQAGDALILTKPIGIGVISAALKSGKLDPAQAETHYAALVDSTTRLNAVGEMLARLDTVHAITDVTGFGLLGHGLEMCRGRVCPRASISTTCHSCRASPNWRKCPTAPARRRETGTAMATKSEPTAWRSGSATCCAIRRRAVVCWWQSRRRALRMYWPQFAMPASPMRHQSARWRRERRESR
ncbi:MAG: selenide, water dikinase SelD [Novosphingobium sp.]